MASSEAMVITNLPRYLIDDVGNAACSAGHDGDIVPPEERATDLAINADFPQTQLEVVISPDVGPGDQPIVCVEKVGFSGEPNWWRGMQRPMSKLLGNAW